ncbi:MULTISPECIES: hypothetical protein [Roseovarius]|jgi:hypothetical protein|uniref:Apolipoprotein acyltransferase n=1 Tax=Roseovarius nubinhibens (strain ATCC BAA-591 / DSM 15170 / ISM) TaxID=89187 RepID=A3SP74_ROSNI|nr:hypothetical protein [Roseovarius nubinhibens]EAP76264.1 hypothetical protein ISM_15400 [Roseovarius nubinhibens ISM]
MHILLAALLGAALGALRARRRKGNSADMVQYGAVHALIFALLALFGGIVFFRLMA